MTHKVYILNDNQATFVCPQCGNVTLTDVSKYAAINRNVTLNCRCKCKHRFKVTLEKRHFYRKETDLPGKFHYCPPNGEMDMGKMRVINISFSGVMIQLDVQRNFAGGEVLKISFNLDDDRKTLYDREVIVRHINHNSIGAAFVQDRFEDPHLGYYLKT